MPDSLMSESASSPADVYALVVAAGDGQRLGATERKAAVAVAGKPLVVWSIEAVARTPGLRGGVLVVHGDDIDTAEGAWLPEAGVTGWKACVGGASRAESVSRGLAALGEMDGWILVHDAARPLVAREDLERVVRAARSHGGAILATPVVDTLERVVDGKITGSVDRRDLWRAETPQVFRAADLQAAHSAGGGEGATDDAMLMVGMGREVRVVESRHPNPKVTREQDLLLVRRLLGV